jgi:hypothetical protein
MATPRRQQKRARSDRQYDERAKVMVIWVLAAQPIPRSVLQGAPLRLPLRTVREAVLWAP